MKSLMRVALCWVALSSVTVPAWAQSAPHTSHNPRFGGAFAAAAGDTLHVEVLFSEQRRLRLLVSDASGSPLSLERLRRVDARAVTGERETPFALFEGESYFEARIPTLTLPATVVIRFKPSADAAEDRLNMSFLEYSPAYGLITHSPIEIPGTRDGILQALAEERRSAQSIVSRGQFPELLGVEDRVRDLVLALEPYVDRLPADARDRAQRAVTAVVRACWLLHTSLDYGSIAQRDAALKQLGEALDRTAAAVSGSDQ